MGSAAQTWSRCSTSVVASTTSASTDCRPFAPRPNKRAGAIIRWFFLQENRAKRRLFGVNEGSQFGTELVATAERGEIPPFFDPKYR
jgi:hypothetical protein